MTADINTERRARRGGGVWSGSRIVVALVGAALVAASCASSNDGAPVFGVAAPSIGSEEVAPEELPTPTTAAPQPSAAELALADMTVEEKVGQLLMPVLAGTSATSVTAAEAAANGDVAGGLATPAEIVARYNLGGVLYLGLNIDTADQLGTLSEGLQRAAEADSSVGLLIAVDQEGGRVSQITDGVTVFPPAATLSGDVEAVAEAGYLTGQQVQLQGVNVVLAPVADLNPPNSAGAIGNRSYGEDPAVVAQMVEAAIDGLQGAGVAAAVKHWPGHGATRVDSHLDLPSLDVTQATWDARERVPFASAIDAEVSIVLVGHLVLPGIDPSADPATFSSVLIDDLLRNQLDFNGVVMTDALNMGALDAYDQGAVVVDAILAGADIMLFPPDLDVAYTALLAAVNNGRIAQERLDQSVLRVLALKESLGLLD
ncbi:MAG: glycoside hydrolase family 3 protein [Actinomycetota bacterium]